MLAPAIIFVAGKRLGPRARSTFAGTAAITWLAAGAAYHVMCPDPSDIVGSLMFVVLMLPWIIVPLAGILAARLAGRRDQTVAGVMLALLGHVVGMIIVFNVPAPYVRGFLGALVDVAAPAIYASAAATIAVTLGRP